MRSECSRVSTEGNPCRDRAYVYGVRVRVDNEENYDRKKLMHGQTHAPCSHPQIISGERRAMGGE